MSAIARRLSVPGLASGAAASRPALYKAALNHGVFALVPLMFTGFVVYIAVRSGAFAVDFHNGEWTAGQRLLHGMSPYFGPHSAAVLSAGAAHPRVTPFVYPGVGAVLYAALALIPHYAADTLFTAFDMAAVALSLKLMDVRDWRLYGLVFLWPPVVIGWQTANITLLLGLGIAALWHYRDRPAMSGPLLALLISLKIVLWPLALWFLATRRYRALRLTAVWGVGLNLIAWSVVGYSEIPRYLSVLQSFNSAGERRSYSLINLALHLGVSTRIATAMAYALAGVVAVLCFKFGRSGHERLAFVLSVGVVLLATPIIWLHYFALLLVPLALTRPRLGPLWGLPLLMFGCPPTEPTTWQIALVLTVSALLVGLMVRAEMAPLRSRPPRRMRWQTFRQ